VLDARIRELMADVVEQSPPPPQFPDQRVACLSLEARGDRWAIDWLEDVAGRSGSAARTVALEALGNLRSRRSVTVLESAAEDRDPTVAKAAFDALTRIKAG